MATRGQGMTKSQRGDAGVAQRTSRAYKRIPRPTGGPPLQHLSNTNHSIQSLRGHVGSSQKPQPQPPADALAYSSLNDPVHATRDTVTTDAIVSVSGKAISGPSCTFDSVRCVDHEMLTNAEEAQYGCRAV
jgi:hypothetical protein